MITQENEGAEPSPPRPGRQIDENLRRVYREMVSEEIPDRFKALLEQLREQDRRP